MLKLEPAPREIEGAPSQPSGGWLADTFRALRHRNYLLYFVGQFVSITGSWLQTTALMWLSWEKTHQAAWPAAISAAQILPTFLLGIWGGSLADRWPKRPLIFATQSAALVLAVLLAALVFLGLDSIWTLFAVAAACGIVNGIDLPARMSFVVEMVGKGDLVNAIALNSLLFNAARVIGPAVGASLLYVVGPGPCFLANGISFVAVLAALWAMDDTQFRRDPGAARSRCARLGVPYRASVAARPGAAERGAVVLRLARAIAVTGAGGPESARWPGRLRLAGRRNRRRGDGGVVVGGVVRLGAETAAVPGRRRGARRRWA